MVRSGDVDEFEMKRENGNDPSIDTCAGGDVRIREHSFDVSCVDFNDKVPYADEVNTKQAEGAVESVYFELGLGVA